MGAGSFLFGGLYVAFGGLAFPHTPLIVLVGYIQDSPVDAHYQSKSCFKNIIRPTVLKVGYNFASGASENNFGPPPFA